MTADLELMPDECLTKHCLLWHFESAPDLTRDDTVSDNAGHYLVVQGSGKSDRLFRLRKNAPTSIGRHSQSDITIDDPYASRSHCSIVQIQDEWLLLHVSRTNATRVNGKRVIAIYLQDGDVIEIGNTQLTFSVVPSKTD